MTAGRKVNTQSQAWDTPVKYVHAVRQIFDGTIDLDPCSNEHSIVHANVEYSLPDKNGLVESWDYQKIYVNPPYGRHPESHTTIANWLQKCSVAHSIYGAEVLALIPVATNTKHWKENIWKKASGVCFLYDTRLKFLEKGIPSKKGAPMACAMIYWGSELTKFRMVFKQFGAVCLLDKELK